MFLLAQFLNNFNQLRHYGCVAVVAQRVVGKYEQFVGRYLILQAAHHLAAAHLAAINNTFYGGLFIGPHEQYLIHNVNHTRLI